MKDIQGHPKAGSSVPGTAATLGGKGVPGRQGMFWRSWHRRWGPVSRALKARQGGRSPGSLPPPGAGAKDAPQAGAALSCTALLCFLLLVPASGGKEVCTCTEQSTKPPPLGQQLSLHLLASKPTVKLCSVSVNDSRQESRRPHANTQLYPSFQFLAYELPK